MRRALYLALREERKAMTSVMVLIRSWMVEMMPPMVNDGDWAG